MSNIQDRNFNKNVSMVYVEEPGFTGYKGFDFTKIDDIEDILRQGVVVSGSIADSAYISGIKINTDNISSATSSIDDKLFITGDPWPAGVQGTIVFQADLSAQFDNVDIAGYAGADISGLNAAVSNNFPVYTSIELFYDGSNNNTGVFYKTNGATTRVINMQYDLSNNLTGVVKIDY